MKMAKNKIKNIFCLETDWSVDLRNKSSIIDALNFLKSNSKIKIIHRQIGTEEELIFRLEEYKKKWYDSYSILYLAFHGEKNGIHLRQNFISLDDLSEILEGQLKNVIVHFGSCSTLNVPKEKITKFLKKTHALCVSGYKSDVSFISSSVFEILYFDMCQNYNDITCIDRDMKIYFKGLCKELKFFMYNL